MSVLHRSQPFQIFKIFEQASIVATFITPLSFFLVPEKLILLCVLTGNDMQRFQFKHRPTINPATDFAETDATASNREGYRTERSGVTTKAFSTTHFTYTNGGGSIPELQMQNAHRNSIGQP